MTEQPVASFAPGSNNANITSVASSASDVLLLAANPGRAGAVIWNDSTAILFVSLGTSAASNASYTVQVASQAGYTVPAVWLGMIRGIWASANGNARVTELS